MRTEQLQYVAAVTRYGSLRRASRHLHISQPALGESLRKLEAELGVTLLDRSRSGTTISAAGRELLQHIADVLDAADRLRAAAGDQPRTPRTVRIGTVNAATSTLLLPAIGALRRRSPGISVDVRHLQPEEIQRDLVDGALDLGLVNLLGGDDVAPQLTGVDLVQGAPVAVLRHDHPLAEKNEVTVDDLRAQRFVAMRAGDLMHRFAHRLFGGDLPAEWNTTGGAEMGEVMVADGLGLAVLPDYTVLGSPLERAGIITTRPIAGDSTLIRLSLQQPRRRSSAAVESLAAELVSLAAAPRD